MNDLIAESIQPLMQNELIDLTDSFSSSMRTRGEKYIIFYLDEKLYAVAARQVVEVMQPLPITYLPRVPEWFSGIVNLRGKIISVINLAKLWGTEHKTVSVPKSKFILLRSITGENCFAFAVDRLNEIARFETEAIEAVSSTDAAYLLGKTAYESEELYFLDAEKIYFSLENGH